MERIFLFGVASLSVLSGAFAAAIVQKRDAVPQYVLDYAPLVYLYSQDPYRPSDMAAQISNTRPEVNYEVVTNDVYTLQTLDQLNSFGTEVYLTSVDDITKNPSWIKGVTPNAQGKTENATTSVIITTDKGNGIVDAFYMYFYAYNWGGKVLNWINLGNHVGDWEHNMIRFQNGVPTYIWYSQHSDGQAFNYKILHKTGLRPLVYSANGSHANYAITGDHEHTIPNLNLPIKGILTDYTDAGVLWDPLLSSYFYSFSNATGTPVFTPYDSSYPTGYLNFLGKWGDEEYPDSDPRQVDVFGQPRYASGPTGPITKQLNRTNICPDNGILCIKRDIISARDNL